MFESLYVCYVFISTLWVKKKHQLGQMAAATSQWWRRLVNAYEVKAGMVC